MIFLIFLTQYFNEALSTSQIPSTDIELVGAIPVRKEIKGKPPCSKCATKFFKDICQNFTWSIFSLFWQHLTIFVIISTQNINEFIGRSGVHIFHISYFLKWVHKFIKINYCFDMQENLVTNGNQHNTQVKKKFIIIVLSIMK